MAGGGGEPGKERDEGWVTVPGAEGSALTEDVIRLALELVPIKASANGCFLHQMDCEVENYSLSKML